VAVEVRARRGVAGAVVAVGRRAGGRALALLDLVERVERAPFRTRTDVLRLQFQKHGPLGLP
jgi:hypothetical protein